MQDQRQKLGRISEELYKLLKERSEVLTNISKYSLVPFIGSTGSGKSTIISYLLDVELEVVKLDGSRIVRQTKQDDKIVHPLIGHSQIKGCTQTPDAYLMQELNIYLCDTAGLQPARPQLKILTDTFLQRAQNIQAIVVVLTLASMQDNRGASFKEVIKDMCKTFSLQEIRSRLIFVYNKPKQDDDSLQDVFDQLCKMEEQAHDQMGKSLEFNQQHMRMFQLIMGKSGFDEKNEFNRFCKSNILCSRNCLTEKNSSFRAGLLQLIRQKSTEQKPVKVNLSRDRIAIVNHLNRRLICRQLDVKYCLENLELYQQSLLIERNMSGSQTQPLENAINNALLTSLKELQHGIQSSEQALSRLEHQQQNQVREVIVTNNPRNSKGQYEFRFKVSPSEEINTEKSGGQLVCKLDRETGICHGVFIPNKDSLDYEARIKILDGSRFQLQAILIQIKNKLNETIKLRKLIFEKGSKNFKALMEGGGHLEARNIRIAEYIDSILSSYQKITEKLCAPEDFDCYVREYFLVSFLNTVKGGMINPEQIDNYKKHPYFYTEVKEDIALRCCMHRHLIGRVRQLQCDHFIEEGCWKLHKKDGQIRCGICQKVCGSLQEPTLKEKVQIIRNSFNKYFQL